MPNKDFIVALNYAYKYGLYNPKNKNMRVKAYIEFGKSAEDKLKKMGLPYPDGLTGIWDDQTKQFVEKGVIDWSWTNKLCN
ncbi:hypothetical protein KJ836_02805 [Patescibacteria group bacterium]|nr:hypothetical protein [Patescibacteria group bacterium]